MNRVAATMASVCTLAVTAISTAVTIFVGAATTGDLDTGRLLGAAGCLGIGSYLIYVGHCRGLMPGGKTE